MYQPWTSAAIRKIESDFQRSANTHLLKLDSPAYPDIHLRLVSSTFK